MKITSAFDISASALTAQRFRMDVIASNIANADVTRAERVNGEWVPYTRKVVHMEPIRPSFQELLNGQMGETNGQGVRVTRVSNDPTPYKLVYNPSHPDADPFGYVKMPNVDILQEMVDMISATRSYEANVTALNASKAMIVKTLEIGK